MFSGFNFPEPIVFPKATKVATYSSSDKNSFFTIDIIIGLTTLCRYAIGGFRNSDHSQINICCIYSGVCRKIKMT